MTEDQFPEWFIHLVELFEDHLPGSKEWLLKAIPENADIENARVPFLISVQVRNLARLKDAPKPYGQQCRDAVQGVIDWLKSDSAESAESARSAAQSAAQSAAWSAQSAAWSAESAAWSAAWSAESAAWSAVSAVSAWSAKSTEYQLMRDDLLEIIRALKKE